MIRDIFAYAGAVASLLLSFALIGLLALSLLTVAALVWLPYRAYRMVRPRPVALDNWLKAAKSNAQWLGAALFLGPRHSRS
jgi:hypothetical protein